MSSPYETIGVTLPVYPFMMMPDDPRDLRIVVDFREDAFGNYRVLFHLAALLKRECPWLLEQSCRQTDLSNVMDKAT